MNVGDFLRNLSVIVNAPNGVRQVRDLVFSMALQGRLSEQQSDEEVDEYATTLQRERAELNGHRLQAEVRKLQLQGSPIPRTWKWTTFDAISENIHYGVTAKAVFKTEGTRFLRITDIQGGRVDWSSVPSCDVDPAKLRSSRLQNGDILIARTGGTIGKTYLVENLDTDAVFASYLIRWIPLPSAYPPFIKLFTNSPLYWAQLTEATSGTGQPNVSASSLKRLMIPLPPLEEQKRIVAKVDELMRLCDRLEAQQQEREKLLPLLSRANHTRLVTKPSAASLQAIFHQPGAVTVTDLRQTIRDLAIRGRLVDQRPTDTPVETLLEQIVSLKCQSGPTSRRSLRNSTIGLAASAQFDAPDNWRWVFLGDVVINRDGERIPVSKEEREKRKKVYDYYGASGIIDKIDAYLFNKPLLLIGEDGANLINRSTPVAFMARGEYWVNNHAHVLDGISEDFLRYIELFINAINLEAYVTGTAQPKMNQAQMNRIPIALPPLEEQIRILAKVDELMRLCDGLESVSSNRKAVSEAFARSAIAAITSTDFTENQRMKPPKTVVVTALKAGEQPQNATLAPLAALLATEISLAPPKTAASADAKRELTAKELWQLSGLEIDAFYRQLKTEIANGWIEEDKDKRAVNEVEAR